MDVVVFGGTSLYVASQQDMSMCRCGFCTGWCPCPAEQLKAMGICLSGITAEDFSPDPSHMCPLCFVEHSDAKALSIHEAHCLQSVLTCGCGKEHASSEALLKHAVGGKGCLVSEALRKPCCGICWQYAAVRVAVPCGHRITCNKCARDMLGGHADGTLHCLCPICRVKCTLVPVSDARDELRKLGMVMPGNTCFAIKRENPDIVDIQLSSAGRVFILGCCSLFPASSPSPSPVGDRVPEVNSFAHGDIEEQPTGCILKSSHSPSPVCDRVPEAHPAVHSGIEEQPAGFTLQTGKLLFSDQSSFLDQLD